ncbi:MAG TPA: beta-ketoacyl synthase N-terminal-like domain-containing protein [Flavobacterium sp.]|jgi:3-oxoacyl-(acyl-carrier-protein) synthase
MKKTYINGMGCVSVQNTSEGFLEEAVANETENVLAIQAPVYKDFISPAAIRRMAKGVKNGIVASAMAMRDANVETVDAIITGTGMGCIEDSETFLEGILDNNEQHLTPTSFIQSTHNTVGAQVALGMQCKAYNFTYVNGAVSFESALLDAQLTIAEGEATSILIGGIDETADYTMSLYKLSGMIKKEDEAPYNILESKSTGVVYGEGAAFFVIEDKITNKTYAEIVDVEICNEMNKEEVAEKASTFLSKNGFAAEDIDAIILGLNGDAETDQYYKVLSDGVFKGKQQLYYKHLSGEYNTASAFGLWVGAKVLKTQAVPDVIKVNSAGKTSFKNILLYNQYKGIDHSFTLISAV